MYQRPFSLSSNLLHPNNRKYTRFFRYRYFTNAIFNKMIRDQLCGRPMAAPLPLPLPLTFLLQFSGIYPHHTLLCNFKVDDTPMQNPEENKIIVGRDIICDLEVDIKFSTAVPKRSWDNFIIPMIHKRGYWSREKLTYVFHTSNLESAVADLDRGSNILPNHWFCISIFSRCQAFKRRFKQ